MFRGWGSLFCNPYLDFREKKERGIWSMNKLKPQFRKGMYKSTTIIYVYICNCHTSWQNGKNFQIHFDSMFCKTLNIKQILQKR